MSYFHYQGTGTWKPEMYCASLVQRVCGESMFANATNVFND